MKVVKSLAAILALSFLTAGFAFANDQASTDAKLAKCCAKAAKDGKECTHACCVEAMNAGKNCEKCGGSGAAEKKK